MPKYKVYISFDEQTITADSEDEAQDIAIEKADFGWADIDVNEITEEKNNGKNNKFKIKCRWKKLFN